MYVTRRHCHPAASSSGACDEVLRCASKHRVRPMKDAWVTFDTDCWSPERSTHWWITWAGSVWLLAIHCVNWCVHQLHSIILPRSILVLFFSLLVSIIITRIRPSTSLVMLLFYFLPYLCTYSNHSHITRCWAKVPMMEKAKQQPTHTGRNG